MNQSVSFVCRNETQRGTLLRLPNGTLAATAFHAAAGATSASDASDRVVYNTTTGDLFYDADGLGGAAAVKFAVLDTHPTLTNADFFVV